MTSFYVIGVFGCGCEHESSYSSTEIVECKTLEEVEKIKGLMEQHSEEFQCDMDGAIQIIVIEGQIINSLKPLSYQNYVKKWIWRDKDSKKREKEYKTFSAKMDRDIERQEERRKRREKL